MPKKAAPELLALLELLGADPHDVALPANTRVLGRRGRLHGAERAAADQGTGAHRGPAGRDLAARRRF